FRPQRRPVAPHRGLLILATQRLVVADTLLTHALRQCLRTGRSALRSFQQPIGGLPSPLSSQTSRPMPSLAGPLFLVNHSVCILQLGPCAETTRPRETDPGH